VNRVVIFRFVGVHIEGKDHTKVARALGPPNCLAGTTFLIAGGPGGVIHETISAPALV